MKSILNGLFSRMYNHFLKNKIANLLLIINLPFMFLLEDDMTLIACFQESEDF